MIEEETSNQLKPRMSGGVPRHGKTETTKSLGKDIRASLPKLATYQQPSPRKTADLLIRDHEPLDSDQESQRGKASHRRDIVKN